MLSSNPNAINIIEKNKNKINYRLLSENPSIFELDYDYLDKRCNIFKEELIKKTLHPSKIMKLLNNGIELEELEFYF